MKVRRVCGLEIYRCDILHSVRKAGQSDPVTQAPEESWIKSEWPNTVLVSVSVCVHVCECWSHRM